MGLTAPLQAEIIPSHFCFKIFILFLIICLYVCLCVGMSLSMYMSMYVCVCGVCVCLCVCVWVRGWECRGHRDLKRQLFLGMESQVIVRLQ